VKASELADYPELVELAYRFINHSKESISSKAESIIIITTTNPLDNNHKSTTTFPWSAHFYANLIMDHVARNASHGNATLSGLLTPNLQYIEEYNQVIIMI
jgi:hypothetical protein